MSGAVGSSSDVYDPATGAGSTVVGVLNTLSSQSAGLSDGARSLSEGLGEVSDALPSYDEGEAVALAEGVTQPVVVEASGVVSTQAGDDAAPAASATALWVGALVLAAVLAGAGVGLGHVAAAASLLVVGAAVVTLLHTALTAGLGGRAGTAVSLLALVLQVVAVRRRRSTSVAGLRRQLAAG